VRSAAGDFERDYMPAFAKTSEGIGHGFGECLHLSGEVPPQQ